jgi:hypothetical protein
LRTNTIVKRDQSVLMTEAALEAPVDPFGTVDMKEGSPQIGA